MEFANLFTLISSIVLLIGLGVLSKRAGLMRVEDSATLNKVIVYIALPALIFLAIRNSKIEAALLVMPLIGWIAMIGSVLFAFMTSRFFNLKRETLGAFLLAAAIGNTGYLGYPLSLAFGGESYLVKAIFYDIFATVLFAFTAGLYFAEAYGDGKDKINKLKEIITFPPLIALAAGLALRGVSLAPFILKSLEYLKGAAVPLIMLSIGISLEMGSLGRHKRLIIALVLIKLALSPLAAFGASALLGLSRDFTQAIILQASMPPAMLSFIIGLKYRLDTDFLPIAIVTATILSVFTVPFWQYVFSVH
ncbi:MAG: AEC family transporter [Actinomycetota bacterium]|nr:AEC family transporter [Actinomycetota bacterium]